MNNRIAVLAFFAACITATNLPADPAAPIEIELEQPDGTTFTAVPRGDEHSNWTETLQGHAVINDGGAWFYARRGEAGELRATDIQVGSLDSEELQSLPVKLAPKTASSAQALASIRAIPGIEASGTREVLELLPAPFTQYLLTILVDYSDISFTYADSDFQSKIYGASNSVKDFYLDNSYGRFTITAPTESYGSSNDGIIHVTREVVHPNQGDNKDISREEAREIVSLSDDFIDYATFDTNADGNIKPDELAIVIIVAGYSASYGGLDSALTPNMWPHRWSFTEDLMLDGVNLDDYTMVSERHATNESNEHIATIGTTCHELGHLLFGLPDLYDTDGSSEGIGSWGLMGNGGWNRTGQWVGDRPGHMSAWSKIATNFTAPEDINSDQFDVSISKADANESAKRVWADKYKLREYFLIENRQKSGFDMGLPGSGLLIWHVDEHQTSNSDETHKWVDLEEADGLNHLDSEGNRGDAGDPFPGSSNNRTFDDSSDPDSRDYAGDPTQIAITGISSSAATMTADIFTPLGDAGDNVSYFRPRNKYSIGYDNRTAWAGLRTQNDTAYEFFDGVDVHINDDIGAVVDIYFYSSMTGGSPSGLLHSETGFAADPGWNRLLLAAPQPFPMGAERGVVLKIVNDSYAYPVSYAPSGDGSGRSYIDANGSGTFYALCPAYCGDLNVAALLSNGEVQSPPSPPVTVTASDGTYTDRIALTWSPVDDAASYNVYYSASLEGEQTLLDNFTGTSVNITGSAPGDVWYFWVYSLNANGESETGTYDTGYIGVEVFEINAGLNDAWYNPVTDGQGFFITVFPDLNRVSLAWFTYDTEHPLPGVTANIGDAGHRWLTALGPITGNQAVMNIKIASGGLFDTPEAEAQVTRVQDGTLTLTFDSCNSGTVDYNIPSIGQSGSVPIVRIADDNIALCESLGGQAALQQKSILKKVDGSNGLTSQRPQPGPDALALADMNPGLNDAWYNPVTDGQGFFITVFPDLNRVSLAWFTYDTEHPLPGVSANLGDAGHRWLTALGAITGNQAVGNIKIASGGLFDTPEVEAQVTRVQDGTLTLTFDTCNSGTVEYNIPSIGRTGTVPIVRIADDNVALCESLSSN